MKFTLKPAVESDFDQMKMIHHRAYRTMVESQFGEWVEHVQDDFFLRTWRRQPFSVVWSRDEIHGFVSINEMSKEAIRRVGVQSVW